ncbi:unnamed protein product [Ectocarpus sp. 4 AP-2014]
MRVRSRSSDMSATNRSGAGGRGGGGETTEERPSDRSKKPSPHTAWAQPGDTGRLNMQEASSDFCCGKEPQQQLPPRLEPISATGDGVAVGLENMNDMFSPISFPVDREDLHTTWSQRYHPSGSQSFSAPASVAIPRRRPFPVNSGGGSRVLSHSSSPSASRHRDPTTSTSTSTSPSLRRRVSPAPISPDSQGRSSWGCAILTPPRRDRSLIRHASRDSLDTSRHSSRASSNHSESSNEEKMSWRPGKKVPAIRLQNGSRHWISYHVLQENKLMTKTVEKNVTNTILASLNATITEGAGARAEGSKSAAVSTRQEGTPHLLVEDYRVPPSDCPGEADHDVVGTTVPFPKGCKELRVLAFLRGKEAWVPYRNKVYPRKVRTIHVITAVDKQLDGYHVSGQDHEVKRRPETALSLLARAVEIRKINLDSLSANTSGPGHSPTNTEAASGGDDELWEDGGASSGGETPVAFEGLKWGGMVQFKMPAEGEVEPNDPLVTLRLPNRYTATLSSKQLRENAGLGKFPVKASKMKGPRGVSDPLGDPPSGNGLVYLRCTLTPIVCPEAEEAHTALQQPTKLTSANKQPARPLGDRLLPAILPNQGESVMEKTSSVTHTRFAKPDTRGIWRRVLKTTVLMLAMVLGTALLSMPGTLLSIPMWMSMPAMPGISWSLPATPSGAVSSSSPSPGTSVWDVRRPDGTAYPHNQLTAAAAVLDCVDFEENRIKGTNCRRHRHQAQPQGSIGEAGGSGSGSGTRSRTSSNQPTSPGEERDTDTTAAEAGKTVKTTARHPRLPDEVDGDGDGEPVARASVCERADGGQACAGGDGDAAHIGLGVRSVVGAIVLAAVAVVVVLMKELIDRWILPTLPEPRAPSSHMQAQVHLLGWDSRASDDTGTLFFFPPSGSSLAHMPHRFLLAESMDVAKAWARWEMTLEWRKATYADNILKKPYPRFALIKSQYAHCFHLPDKWGRVTYYERPGMSDFAEMRKVGITMADLLNHYIYCMEYLWQVLQPRQSQRITIIIDLAGVKFIDLVREGLALLKASVEMMSRHYPERCSKIMILNEPSFFNSVFPVVESMLNGVTKNKIDRVANMGEEMMKVIPAEHLPVHYGGAGEAALGESPAELALLAHVEKVLEEHGQTMQT